MDLQQFINATERIKKMHEEIGFAIALLLGALKGTQVKQQSSTTQQPYSKQMPAVLPEGATVRRYKNKTIKKRPDGRWWTRYYDKNGKQHSVYGHTPDEVVAKLKIALQQDKQPTKTCYTLGQWLDKWFDLYKVGKLKPTTTHLIQRNIKDVAPIANLRLDKITSIQLQEFFNSIKQQPKQEKLHIMLKDAFTKAVKNKLIADNPMADVEITRHKSKTTNALTQEQEKAFVDACRTCKHGDLLLICLYQGLRLGEAAALTYEDVDFEKGTISINKAVDHLGNLTTPKTETSNRVIPLFKRTRNVMQTCGTGKIVAFERKAYQHAISKIAKQLAIPGLTIHTLRHTFATRCAEANVPAKVVQKWLGHSTLEMTLNVYTHVNRDFEREMSQKIDTYFDT